MYIGGNNSSYLQGIEAVTARLLLYLSISAAKHYGTCTSIVTLPGRARVSILAYDSNQIYEPPLVLV